MPTEDDWFRCGRYQEAGWFLEAARNGEVMLTPGQRELCEREIAPGPPAGWEQRSEHRRSQHGMSRGMEAFDKELGVSLG